jgi:preprotein translocase subunit YajC
MTSDLRVGDEVLTAGGIYGTISRLDEDQVTVEIAPRTEVRVARRAIAGVTREPEPGEDGKPEEAQDDEGERWQSAFDDEGSGRDTSNEENRG